MIFFSTLSSKLKTYYYMARKFLLSLTLAILGTLSYAQTSLSGKITDKDTGEELIGANIVMEKNGSFAAGSSTDFDGNYSISVDPGTYDITFSYIGSPDNKITSVIVKAGQANRLDVQLGGEEGVLLDVVVVTEYKVPLIEQDNTTSGGVVTSEQIKNLPTKNINALAAQTAGIASSDEGEDLNVKGGRSSGTNYYIDGVRVSGNLVPQSEIDQMQVITGGVGAQYGDVTGGIISITTKGPSNKFSGGVEAETSQFLDSYGYNLLSLNLSGPILKKKTGETLLGFRVSGQYVLRDDDDPPATGVYRIKDSKLEELKKKPLTRIGTALLPTARLLTLDDVELLDARPFEKNERLDFTAKLDARISDNVDITFSGNYSSEKDQFTPANSWRLLNVQNNPTSTNTRYRGNFRFRHRLGNTGVSMPAEGDEAKAKKGALIRNAQYTIQVGYQKSFFDVSDPVHEDRLFDYGHIGDFNRTWDPVAGLIDTSAFLNFRDFAVETLLPNGTAVWLGHLGNSENFTDFDASASKNPRLALYNAELVDPLNEDAYAMQNGFSVGDVGTVWNLHTNVGQIYNRFQKTDNDRYTVDISSSFDFMPGGSDKGRHSIQFGILYEQRVNRGYTVFPRSLWTVARGLANNHITALDYASPTGDSTMLSTLGVNVMVPLYNTLTTNPEDSKFYKEIRKAVLPNMSLDNALHEYVNVLSLDPSQLRMDMFSARELIDNATMDYYGYDYLGNKLGADVTFDDFFTTRDADGLRTHPVAPNQPIYWAAYIQDKFIFRDIIFKLGLRVDRYDANTKVLKDPYSLYDIMDANDFYNQTGGSRPANIGDDFKVYVSDSNEEEVTAFRDGDQWYQPNGVLVNDPTVIFGTKAVNPRYANDQITGGYIKDEDFQTSTAFKDYEPQINWMPRLAFSFPISDEANFFAHYDILVQRPPANTIATALDYFYFYDRPSGSTNPLANPDLRPEQTIDYEVGFKQKLSNSSAMTITTYYREMRDMIQQRTYTPVPIINQYTTYGNLDFGTVKGFTFQYDLRRTNNVTVNAGYTLQFADGTGSNSNSQRGLNKNLRTIFPLSYDERHRFNAAIDFRYRSGKKYNGPRWFGSDVFANAGINIQANAVSGRPYTARRIPTSLGGSGVEGSLNGARLPWNFTIGFKIDKTFRISSSDSKRALNINVYFRVQNLLDTRNIDGVYSASGSPDDDGFLQSSTGQELLDSSTGSIAERNAYLASYQWRLLNPGLYKLPRRIFIGAIFDF